MEPGHANLEVACVYSMAKKSEFKTYFNLPGSLKHTEPYDPDQ
jgi:hypothetical protein